MEKIKSKKPEKVESEKQWARGLGLLIDLVLGKDAKVEEGKNVLEIFMHMANVEFDFLEDPIELKRIRQELKDAKKALIMSNHPGLFEIIAMLQILAEVGRTDVKFVANQNNPMVAIIMKKFPQHFIGLDKTGEGVTNKSALGFAKAVKEHEGIIGFLPTGQREGALRKEEERKFEFEGGADLVMRLMKPEDLVYCLHVDVADQQRVFNKKNFLAALARLPMLKLRKNSPKPKKKPYKIRVREKCTTAGNWPKKIKKLQEGKELREALTSFYLRLFGIDISNKEIMKWKGKLIN